LKAGGFSPTLLVPVALTGTNGLYKPGLMASFPPGSYPPLFLSFVILKKLFVFTKRKLIAIREEGISTNNNLY
jgi:hypothetical protein